MQLYVPIRIATSSRYGQDIARGVHMILRNSIRGKPYDFIFSPLLTSNWGCRMSVGRELQKDASTQEDRSCCSATVRFILVLFRPAFVLNILSPFRPPQIHTMTGDIGFSRNGNLCRCSRTDWVCAFMVFRKTEKPHTALDVE